MQWLTAIIVAVIRALLPWVANQVQPTAEDADPDLDVRDRLRTRVREHWARLLIIGSLLLAAGCQPRTIYVPDGTPVRLRQTVGNAKVWVKDAEGEIVPGVMDLPEGWYALPLDDRDRE